MVPTLCVSPGSVCRRGAMGRELEDAFSCHASSTNEEKLRQLRSDVIKYLASNLTRMYDAKFS